MQQQHLIPWLLQQATTATNAKNIYFLIYLYFMKKL